MMRNVHAFLQGKMASFHKHNNGFRAQVVVRGVVRRLWLGRITKSGATIVCNHLEALKVATETATPAASDSLRWSQSVDIGIREKLAEWGLIQTAHRSIPSTVGPYADRVAKLIGGAASTQKRWKNTIGKLKEHLSASTQLARVTPGDADRISRAIRKQHSSTHAGKLLGDIKQVFTSAIRDKLISENPFEDIDTKGQHDKQREAYIERATITQLLEHCDDYYAALITLARYAGLRVPSEPLALQWHHIDLPGSRLTIHSPKTGFRVCPVFPEIKPYLERLWESSQGQEFVFNRARSSANNVWRCKLLSICQAASVKPWPKLWQNLRASCRSDLESRFPQFVCNDWMGHSSRVAAKHYSRITDEHFRLAAKAEKTPTKPTNKKPGDNQKRARG